MNTLGLNAKYGKVANYYFTPYINDINFSDRIIVNKNDNIELSLYSSFLKNRFHFNVNYYNRKYKDYHNLISFYVPNGSSLSEQRTINNRLGKMTLSGLEFNGNLHLIKKRDTDWKVNLSYSANNIDMVANEELSFFIPDTTVNNNLITISNTFKHKNFQFFIEFEGKNGADVFMNNNNFSGPLPYSYGQNSIISGVNNESIPTEENIEEIYSYIVDTNYFILKNVGVDYKLGNTKKQYLIGLQYNRMRRIYSFVRDVELNRGHLQKPSFFSAVSLSFKMRL